MSPTVKAVLARWKGNRTDAIQYCYTLIDSYPQLRKEYLGVVESLTGENNVTVQTHARVVEVARFQIVEISDSRLAEVGRSESIDAGRSAALAFAQTNSQ